MPVDFEAAVLRAALAPTVHNVQPARWKRDGAGAWLAADLAVGLAHGDPLGRDLGLSCGAVCEAMVLALAAQGFSATVTDLWAADDRAMIAGHRMAARIKWEEGGQPDGLSAVLEVRYTHRGEFGAEPVALFGWGRGDALLVTDPSGKDWLADRHDWAGLQAMRDPGMRHELLHWMRLSGRHPRYKYDGLGREAMRLSPLEALAARFALGPLWGLCDRLGVTAGLTTEAKATQSAQVVALFHRAVDESPVTSGRAYLRMCLEAAHLGLAGWPMAAVSDHPQTNAEVCARYGIGPDQRLVQVIRFGVAGTAPPPRARRPLDEVLL
jgi:hypothetical protein